VSARLALLLFALLSLPGAALSGPPSKAPRPDPAVHHTPADMTPGPPPGARILAASQSLPMTAWGDYVALDGSLLHVRIFTCPHCRRMMGDGWRIDLDHVTAAGMAPVLAGLQLDPEAADWTTPTAWRAAAGNIPVGMADDPVAGRWSDCGIQATWSVLPVDGGWLLDAHNVTGPGVVQVGATAVDVAWRDVGFSVALPRPMVAGDEIRMTDARGVCSVGLFGSHVWPHPLPSEPGADARLLLGGLYGPDHSGPEAWAQTVERIGADPYAFARTVAAELDGPSASPEMLAAWRLVAPLDELWALDAAAVTWLAPRIWGHVRAAALGRRGPLSADQARKLAVAQERVEVWIETHLGGTFGWSAVGWTVEAAEIDGRDGVLLRAWPVRPERWAESMTRAVTPTVQLAGEPAHDLRIEADGRLAASFPRTFATAPLPISVAMFGHPGVGNGLALEADVLRLVADR
jgi:hypothetical protein